MEETVKVLKIWINGASRGIGAAIARRFASEDVSIVLTASSMSSFRELKKEFKDNKKIYFFACDITSLKEINRTYDKIQKLWNCPDILINNAGISIFKEFSSFSAEEFDKVVSVNFRGNFLCTRAVIQDMLKQKKGAIINILSIAAVKAFTNSSIYAATKAAVLAMDRSLREEVRANGIKIIDILPGATETDIWDEVTRAQSGYRMIKPEDIADSVYEVILMSRNQRYMVEEIIIRPQMGDL